MKNPREQNETAIRAPSSGPQQGRPARRPKRRFALIAVPSTIIVCAAAAGLAVLGMNQHKGQGLVDAARPILAAVASSRDTADQVDGDAADKAKSVETARETQAPAEKTENSKGGRAQTASAKPLAADHARWGDAGTGTASANSKALKRKLESFGKRDMDSQPTQTASASSRDEGTTASIPGQTAYAAVPVADNEAEVAALESIIAADPSENGPNEEGGTEPSAAAPVSWEADATDMRAASASDGVHLRAQPGKDGDILTVVPKGGSMQAAGDCSGWCAVSFNGQHGWVYEEYVRYSQNAVAQSQPQAVPGVNASAQPSQEQLPAPTRAPKMSYERLHRSR